MHICFYTETALPKIGGQQIAIDHLARGLVGLGHDVTVLTQPPRPPLVAGDEEFPYRVVRHPRYVSTAHLMSWYRRYLVRLHRARPIDVLHCHSLYPTAYLAALVKARLGVRVVLTSHGGDVRPGGGMLGRKPRLLSRYVQGVKAADALVAISRFTHEGFLHFDPAAGSRITDIPNGVSVAEFAEPGTRPVGLPDSIRAGGYVHFIGRLTRQKGVDTLLRAMALLPSLPLVVTGGGPEEEALRALGESLGLQNVHFVGSKGGLEKSWLLQNAIATVVPSREYEAFGLVVLESYAAGRPVIASDLPGLADLVTPETGLLVPPDAPERLAAAIGEIVGTADGMGQAGRRFAAGYEWAAIAARHADLYSRLIAGER